MNRYTSPMVIILSLCLAASAQAGMFDSLLNKAKNTAEKAVTDTLGKSQETQKEMTQEPAPAPTGTKTAPAPSKSKSYDSVLVKQIQTRLNGLGYNAGKPDGLYGPGTRKAIESFQSQNGYAVTGMPSQTLLAQLNQAGPAGGGSPSSGNESGGSAQAFSSASNIASGVYIDVDDLSTDRMPLLAGGLSMLRFKFEPNYGIDEKALIAVTKQHVICHRVTDGNLKMDTRVFTQGAFDGTGCIGQRIAVQNPGEFADRYGWRYVRVFDSDQVKDRNPDFAARELKGKMLTALRKAGRHMSAHFAETGGWRGKYDFDTGKLTINARPFEPLPPSLKGRLLPASEQNRDAYKVRRSRFGVEFDKLKILWPPVDTGVETVAFDRLLGEGRFKMSASDAEKLMSNKNVTQKNGGMAVVEFTVENTEKGAALARLDKVVLLAKKGKQWADLEPYMTIPASAFPKAAKLAAVQKKSAPKPAPKALVKAVKAPEEKPDPFIRANTGKSFGPDMVDLRLGMTMEEADKIIRKRKEPIMIVDGRPHVPFAHARIYALKPGDESIALFTLKTTTGERVAGIQRMVYFSPDDAPSQTAIAASVENKYGKPSYKYEVKSRFEWAWRVDWKGKQVSDNSCTHLVGNGGADAWKDGDKYFTWALPWNNGARGSANSMEVGNEHDVSKVSHCGTVLNIDYSENSGMRIGPTLTFHLYDPAWVVAADAARRTAEKKKGADGLDL